MQFLKEIFTDANGRPEIKMVLAVPLFFAAIVYVIVTSNLAVFGVLMGTALSLFGFATAGDAAIDKK
jgi:hypothetical protein